MTAFLKEIANSSSKILILSMPFFLLHDESRHRSYQFYYKMPNRIKTSQFPHSDSSQFLVLMVFIRFSIIHPRDFSVFSFIDSSIIHPRAFKQRRGFYLFIQFESGQNAW